MQQGLLGSSRPVMAKWWFGLRGSRFAAMSGGQQGLNAREFQWTQGTDESAPLIVGLADEWVTSS
jgi:hypothetical protein